MRPSRRRALRWPTWLWVAGAWVWVAQAVWQGESGLTAASARAGLGPGRDGLSAEWRPPVPAYQAEVLPAVPVVTPEAGVQAARLSERGEEWVALSDSLRAEMDRASRGGPGGRAPWRRVVVEGTGERTGSAKDLKFSMADAGEAGETTGGPMSAHFVIGNGTRSTDGAIETTGRPLEGESLVVALVGDFAHREPSEAQLKALTELADYARAKVGVIPVVVGEAARAPVAGSVLDQAFNRTLAKHPEAAEERH